MNTIITSKEDILDASRKIAAETGVPSINIRSVAARCGVSVGSVYNYFPSKAELIASTVKKIWEDIFSKAGPSWVAADFEEYVIQLYDTIQRGSSEYPSFFALHSLAFSIEDKGKGREVMINYFSHIKDGLLQTLLNDKRVQKDSFSSTFTESDFVDFVFSNIISLLLRQSKNCDTLIEIIKRIIL